MKHYDTMTGYKATNADMTCKGYKFELGKWYKHDGKVQMCVSGFHFCVHPSGVWSYYSHEGVRVFKVEARDVYEEYESGSKLKVVCSEIRFVEEITIGGNSNAGDSNTGDWNTGDCNTGNSNTGNWNTGNWNTGDSNTGNSNTGDSNTGNSNTGDSNTGNRNTGDSNTGDWNTGDWNTGNRNTGDSNTGNRNTGDRNTGNRNTGDSNTGNWNTGDSNTTDNCSGFFCAKEPCVISFDKQTKLTRKEFYAKHPEINILGDLLSQDEPFDYSQFKTIPGWTLAECTALHQKHIEGRKAARL